jgi:hypothetical protein
MKTPSRKIRLFLAGGIAVCLAAFVAAIWLKDYGYRWTDAHNLKSIWYGVMMYSEDAGALPHDIAALIDASIHSPGKVWVSPLSDTVVPESAMDIRRGLCDYVYLGSGIQAQSDKSPGAADTLLLYTKPGKNGKWISICFLDGHVLKVRASDNQTFLSLVEKQGWKIPERQSGSRGSLTPSPHTTVHAGPHTAVH